MDTKKAMAQSDTPMVGDHFTLAPVVFPTTNLGKKPVYSMVVLYQNPMTGIRAKHFSENLMRELGDTMLWTTDIWDFKLLDLADVRRAATEAAAIADVVILALDGHVELPDGVKAWMEEWGGRLVDGGPILIALFSAFDAKQKAMASTRAFLATIAETCGLTFLHTLGESVVEYRLVAEPASHY
jgi:hypothetical protein